jgi:hypothetical protein
MCGIGCGCWESEGVGDSEQAGDAEDAVWQDAAEIWAAMLDNLT